MLRKWRELTLHKSDVRPDDNILVDGHWITLCKKDFRSCPFWGLSIRGDSYGLSGYLVRVRRLVTVS